MKYIEFGKNKDKISNLGFGCMRLPFIGDQKQNIDKNKTFEMMEYAFSNGVNYFDTAYPYHAKDFYSKGNSENVLGEFIADKRDKVYVATKMSMWFVENENDLERVFEDQLKSLNTEYIDYYLIHSVNSNTLKKMNKLNMQKFLDKKINQGKIRNIGFSFHDTFDVFKSTLDFYDWDMCQIQYNFKDVNYQAGKQGLELAKSKGLSVAIMEPLRGGQMLKINEEATETLSACDSDRSIADLCFSWLLDNAKDSLVLSGMSHIDHVKENVEIFSREKDQYLSPSENKALENVKNIIEKSIKIDCTGCSYCLPCPQNIKIPMCFACYNDYYLFDNDPARAAAVMRYGLRVPIGEKASQCVSCGLCEERCPQKIKISEEMKKVSKLFD